MTRRLPILAAAAAVAAALLAGCAGSDDTAPGLRVVATTTMLGDLATNVVGDDGVVEVLIPVGADPHDFQASSRQVASLTEADLVIANGLGLEEGLGDVLDGAASDGANVLRVAESLDPLPFAAADPGAAGGLDPHVWFDPMRMAEAARLVAGELGAIDPSVDWAARAEAYAADLAAADAEIAGLLGAVPPERRKLVTSHDSLGYLADRYGFEVIGTVMPGGSTLGNPSSADLAALVATLEAAGVRVLFGETTEPAVLAEAVAAELGADVRIIDLYTGSLGPPGSGADTLIGMLLTDARLIAEALA